MSIKMTDIQQTNYDVYKEAGWLYHSYDDVTHRVYLYKMDTYETSIKIVINKEGFIDEC